MKNSVVSVALCAVLLAGCNGKKEQPTEQNAVTVTVLPVVTSQSGIPLNVSGNIDAEKTVRIGFLVAGRIGSIPYEEGQTVGKGQLVATIEPINYDIANDAANAQLKQADDEYHRLKIMHDRGSLSDADFQKATTAKELATQQARAKSTTVSDTRIFAPFSGIVSKKLAEKGEIVSQGMPVMVISDISNVNINAYIPENELKNIKIGQEAEVIVSALDFSTNGKITEVGGVADPSSRSFTIKIKVPNPGNKIRPGMIAEANIPITTLKSGIFIPAEALIRGENNRRYVYVADPKSGKAFTRDVSIGQISDNRIEVVSGLSEGEKIIVAGQNHLVNGSLINIKNQ